MQNIFEQYNDYVVFLPVKKELQKKYFEIYEKSYIEISSNDKASFFEVCDSRHLFDECDVNNIIGRVVVINDPYIFQNRYDLSTYDESAFILKTHPMYIEGVCNNFFETGNSDIHIYHYPNESFHAFFKDNLFFLSIVNNKNDTINNLLYGIKKIASRYYENKGFFSLHAAAVALENKGFIFLSGSHSGKSTLFINLVASSCVPINDDIVFWQKKGDKIYIKALPTLPHIRTRTTETVACVEKLQGLDISNKEYLSKLILGKESKGTFELVSIFIPEIGYSETSIEKVQSQTFVKKLLRAIMVHGSPWINDLFLDAFNTLCRCEMFKLNMSNDYTEICKQLKKYMTLSERRTDYGHDGLKDSP